MSNAAQFATPDAALAALTAGNATITLVSKKTGTRFTYKVAAPKENGETVRFVSVLTGSNNEDDFTYAGMLRKGQGFRQTAGSKIGGDAASVKAFTWAFNQLRNGVLPETLEVWHEGRCCRCGRKLTVPSSIESGIGPDCAEKMAG